MAFMNKDPNAAQVLPVTNDREVVFTAKVIPIPLFLIPLFLADNTPKKALSMFHHFYNKVLQEMCTVHENANAIFYKFLLTACNTEKNTK